LSILKNSKNQNLNKFIIKGKNGDEHAWRIILYKQTTRRPIRSIKVISLKRVDNAEGHIISIYYTTRMFTCKT